MEHIAALLLLIGCSDDMKSCQELPAPVPVYETAIECESDLEAAMISFSDRYPQILGQCVGVDPAAEYSDAELVWDVNADGALVATFEEAIVQVASK